MKNKHLKTIFVFLALLAVVCSCKKIEGDDDKNKIDIKGSMTNGDMRNPNIEAYFEGNTVWVQFNEGLGICIVSINSRDSSMVTSDTIETYPDASWRFYMGDQPQNRYHFVIKNDTDEADGWFYNFKMAAVRPRP